MKMLQRLLGSWYQVPLVKLIAELVLVILPVAFFIRTVFFGLYQVPTGSMETTLLVGERFFADKFTYWFKSPQRGDIIAFNDPRYNYSSNKLVNVWERYASLKVMNWTKRVIGIPGDHIKGTIENGHPVVYRNGQKLDESAYTNKYPLIGVYLSGGQDKKIYQKETTQRSFDPAVTWDKQVFYNINPDLIIRNSAGAPSFIVYPGTPQTPDIFDVTLKANQYWVMGDNRLGSSDSRFWGILDGTLIHGKIIFRIISIDSDDSYWFIDLLKHPLGFWKKIRWSRCLQWV